MLKVKAIRGPEGTQVTSVPETLDGVNIGEINVLQGVIEVYDQDGNLLCEQPLANTATTVTGVGTFLSSAYGNVNQGAFDTNVNWAVNPVTFATSSPGEAVVSMTGYGCQAFVPGPVTAQDVLPVSASVVGGYTGQIYTPQYYSGFFNFESQYGEQSTITFANIVNAGDVPGNFGILQLVLSSIRYATLQNGTNCYIANSTQQALDNLEDAVMNPVELVDAGATFSITLQDAPGLQIVNNWMLNNKLEPIQSYTIQDSYLTYLMYQSTRADAQWVALASVNWSIAGQLLRNGNGWQVNNGFTQIQQPQNGTPFPPMPVWNGTAQGNVLASVVNNQYYQSN